MNALFLAMLIGVTGQPTGYATGQLSPTSDLSSNRVKATGSTTARALKDRFADTISVKDFGAKGDGVTDDTAAIQAAVNAGAGKVNIFFPAGVYVVSSPISLDGSPRVSSWRIRGSGAYLSQITGNFADYIIKRTTTGSTNAGTHVIEDLAITNTSTSSSAGGIRIADEVGARISRVDVSISGGVGIGAFDNVFTTFIDNATVTGASYNGIGIVAKNHVTITAPDVHGLSEGIRASGLGMVVQGGRFEVNTTGLVLGKDETGSTYAFYGHVLGNRFEANDTAVNVVSMQSSVISAATSQGSTNSPSGQSKIGLLVQNATNSLIQGVAMGGSYSDTAIRVAGTFASMTWEAVSAANSLYPGTVGAKVWDIQGNISSNLGFVGSFPDLNATGVTVPTVLSGMTIAGLTQLDNVNGNKAALNLRGKDISVGTSVTSVSVVFPAFHDSGNGLNTATAAAGGSLAGGTYYYASTFVNALGESASGPTKSATVDGVTNQSVTLTFFGTGTDAWRRRVYRGRSSGVYDGYYDLPLNSSASYTDTGAAFTGVKSPPVAGTTLPSAAEPDSSYAITCTPQWDARCWVTSKATTGFTLNFDPGPVSTSAVDWHLIR